jgi:TPR repeat protein
MVYFVNSGIDIYAPSDASSGCHDLNHHCEFQPNLQSDIVRPNSVGHREITPPFKPLFGLRPVVHLFNVMRLDYPDKQWNLTPVEFERWELQSICSEKASNWAIMCITCLYILAVLYSLCRGKATLRCGAALGFRGFEYDYAISLTENKDTVTDSDWELSMYFLNRSANKNYSLAQCELSRRLTGERDGKQDRNESVRSLKLAVDQGLADAQYEYGLLLSQSGIIPVNETEAARQFDMAASQGHAKAMYEFGKCLKYGRGVAQNLKLAVGYFRLAAHRGESDAQVAYGLYLLNSSKLVRGARYLRFAAAQNNSEAEFWYGICLRDGMGVPEKREDATVYLNRSAARGNAAARLAHEGLLNSSQYDQPRVDSIYSRYSLEQKVWDRVRHSPPLILLFLSILTVLCSCAVYSYTRYQKYLANKTPEQNLKGDNEEKLAEVNE